MIAHGSRLLGDGSFLAPRTLFKWMDLRVSPIVYTLFDQCDIYYRDSDCVLKLMSGIVSPVDQIEGGFLINEWKNVMDAHRSRLLGDGSFFGTQDIVKMDGFESFSNITHIFRAV